LVCGILIGPAGLPLFSDSIPWISYVTISDAETVKILGEFGIIALMFMIGLELSFNRLKELKRYIFGFGSLQIIVTATAIFAIAYMFGNSMPAAILIGASFALSSTAIVMKLLEERRLSNRPVGVLCFSILLMQDLAVVPILVMASFFTGNPDANLILKIVNSLIIGAATIAGIYWIGKPALKKLLKSVSFSSNSPEWLAAFIVFIVLV
jgi:CPA2 family monovalent cation:H+ antiporter-2